MRIIALCLSAAIFVVVIGCIVVVVYSDTGVERYQTEPRRM